MELCPAWRAEGCRVDLYIRQRRQESLDLGVWQKLRQVHSGTGGVEHNGEVGRLLGPHVHCLLLRRGALIQAFETLMRSFAVLSTAKVRARHEGTRRCHVPENHQGILLQSTAHDLCFQEDARQTAGLFP